MGRNLFHVTKKVRSQVHVNVSTQACLVPLTTTFMSFFLPQLALMLPILTQSHDLTF